MKEKDNIRDELQASAILSLSHRSDSSAVAFVARAVVFQNDVVANGVYEGTEAVGFSEAAIGTYRANHASERLLTQIVYGVRSQMPGPEL